MYGGVEVYIHVSLNSALVRGELSASRTRRFTPKGKSPRYQSERRLGGPKSRHGRHGELKILGPTWNQTPNSSPSFQPIFLVFKKIKEGVCDHPVSVCLCISLCLSICMFVTSFFSLCIFPLCLGLLVCRDRRFESYSRHGCLCVCVRLFYVCVVLCRSRSWDELITRPRSPTDCPRLRNWKFHGCPMLQWEPKREYKKYSP
jgi:hypothetical protein